MPRNVSTSIAVAGKGGVGKTLISGMLARWLSEQGEGPVLAVDADANANLHEVLNISAGESVGAIREELKSIAGDLPAGMTKAQFLEYKIETALVEADNLDLITMGRPEGPGCYCYANNLLRDILGKVAHRYRYVVIDNEAGMEHLSRRLMQRIDFLLIVSDATLRGLKTAFRLSQIPDEVETRVVESALVVNRIPSSGLSLTARDQIRQGPLPLLSEIPEDSAVSQCDQELGGLNELFPDSEMARHVVRLGCQLVGAAARVRSTKP